jgi:hypothetical protein
MTRALTVTLGVVIARERVDNPWQDHVWRPVSVFLNAPEIDDWRELRRDDASAHYHAATLPLELHAKDTLGYSANLAEEAPAVWVVLRQGGAGDKPVHVALLTASPHEAEAYGHGSEEQVDTVAMPGPLVDLLQAFVAEHHVEEPFVKRQRQKHHRDEDHKFGQEPVDVLRQRQGGTRREPGAGQ